MTERRPIVLINGKLQELPDGDTVPGSGSGGGGGSSLPGLAGNAGKKLRVNSAETAVEWGYDYGITPLGPTPHGAHRYWRLTSMYQDDQRYVQVAGLKFRGVPSGPNLATGGTPIESGHYSSNVAANAFDGNPSTVWEGNSGAGNSASGNIWVGYDFGAPVAIVEVEVEVNATYETDERPRAGWVHYSDNGTNWVAAWPFGTWTWDTLIKTSTSPFWSSFVPDDVPRPFASGASGSFGGWDDNTGQTKGCPILPNVSVAVKNVFCVYDAYDGNTDQHYAQIVELDASNNVVAVLGTSDTQTSVSADAEAVKYNFATPVNILAGNRYALLICRLPVGRNTTICPLLRGNGLALNWDGELVKTFLRFNTVGVTVGQAPISTVAGSCANVWINGRVI